MQFGTLTWILLCFFHFSMAFEHGCSIAVQFAFDFDYICPELRSPALSAQKGKNGISLLGVFHRLFLFYRPLGSPENADASRDDPAAQWTTEVSRSAHCSPLAARYIHTLRRPQDPYSYHSHQARRCLRGTAATTFSFLKLFGASPCEGSLAFYRRRAF